ncbi:hypothetical protein NHQ30_005750 [Ciborinia camelliae]|nr:hypothetical protein NHQ30_005750 [Ciborinia camelliae]
MNSLENIRADREMKEFWIWNSNFEGYNEDVNGDEGLTDDEELSLRRDNMCYLFNALNFILAHIHIKPRTHSKADANSAPIVTIHRLYAHKIHTSTSINNPLEMFLQQLPPQAQESRYATPIFQKSSEAPDFLPATNSTSIAQIQAVEVKSQPPTAAEHVSGSGGGSYLSASQRPPPAKTGLPHSQELAARWMDMVMGQKQASQPL